MKIDYIKGMDISSLLEVERCGGRFFNKGVEQDAIEILREYGVNAVRLRLWNDPYDENGRPYGAGTDDLPAVTALAKRAKAAGMKILLDFQYSDFWADPGKQVKPKAWRNYTVAQLEEAVYGYTKEVLTKLKEEGVYPEQVQVGNELTNGLLWPEGKKPEYDNIARFVSAGIRAVREMNPDTVVVVHLDNGGNNEMYRDWFDHYFKRGKDFDVIGLSYYPFWHGTLEALQNNMNDLAMRYKKDLIVVEVSMGYTMEDYAVYEKLAPEDRKGMATKPELAQKAGYSMTVQGQCDFMRDVLRVLENVPEGRGRGFYYWEPAWIPVPGSGWATWEALAYTGEAGPCGNEWANQALFDYQGNALETLQVIKDYKPKE